MISSFHLQLNPSNIYYFEYLKNAALLAICLEARGEEERKGKEKENEVERKRRRKVGNSLLSV